MLSGNSDSGAEKGEKEHQELTMTLIKQVMPKREKLYFSGKLVSLSCIEGQKP